VLTTDAPGTVERPGAPLRRTLGYSSDGFRTLLATQVRAAPRKTFSHFADWLFGGESTLGQLATILVLLAASAAVAGFAWFGAPRPSIAAPSLDPAMEVGQLTCSTSVTDGNPIVTSCSVIEPAPKLTTADLAQGCYIGILRVVGPAPTEATGLLRGSTTMVPVPPPASPLDAQCLDKGFKPADVLDALDGTMAANITALLPTASEDGLSAKREMTIAHDGAAPVLVTDFVWIGYAASEVSVSLRTLWAMTFPGTNTTEYLFASPLCLDAGVRMHAVPLGDPVTASQQARALLDDGLATGLQYLRFRFTAPETPLQTVGTMLDLPLTVPTVEPFVDPATQFPGEPTTLPLLADGLLTNSDGTPRERLIGSCPPNG
jgi:hypothetical protein